MGKKWRYVTFASAMIILASFIFLFTRHKDPVYEGRTLTEWLRQFEAERQQFGTVDPNAPKHADSVRAIRAIGTNAVPTLLKLIQESRMEKRLDNLDYPFLGNLWRRFRNSRGSDHDKRLLAALNIIVLDQDSTPHKTKFQDVLLLGAAPERIDQGLPPDNRVSWMISCTRAPKQIGLPLLVQLLDYPEDSRYAASTLQELYPEEAEKAGVFKLFPDLKTKTNNPPVANNRSS